MTILRYIRHLKLVHRNLKVKAVNINKISVPYIEFQLCQEEPIIVSRISTDIPKGIFTLNAGSTIMVFPLAVHLGTSLAKKITLTLTIEPFLTSGLWWWPRW